MVTHFFRYSNGTFDFGLHMLRGLRICICSNQKIQAAFPGIIRRGIKDIDTLNIGLNDPFPACISLQHFVPRTSKLTDLRKKLVCVLRCMILTDSGRKLGFTFFEKSRLILAHIIPQKGRYFKRA